MKLRSLIVIVLMAALVSSCKEATNHSDDGQTIELNNGEKWQINAEMTPFIVEGEQVLASYAGDDHKMLSEQLEKLNGALIKSCTMDGKSHDELHKWLHPHLELVEELNNAESKEKADEVVDEIKKSFETFHTYFQ